MFDLIFGLPAHPLLVHAPIVLLPLVAIVSIVLAVKPAWRQRAGWFPVASLLVVWVMLFAAKQSGEALLEAYDRTSGEGAVPVDEHARLADTTVLISFVWLIIAAALTAVERVDGLRSKIDNQMIRQVGAGASAVLGVLATIWLIRTGHEGAKSVWGLRVDILFPDS